MPVLSLLNSHLRRLRQWSALDPAERLILIRFFFLLPAVRAGLRLRGFNRMHRFAECRMPSAARSASSSGAQNLEIAQRYATLTGIAARHGVHKANCLTRSLALCRLLRRKGIPASLKIGVRTELEPFEAHAWVELDALPINESVAEFSPFDGLVDSSRENNRA